MSERIWQRLKSPFQVALVLINFVYPIIIHELEFFTGNSPDEYLDLILFSLTSFFFAAILARISLNERSKIPFYSLSVVLPVLILPVASIIPTFLSAKGISEAVVGWIVVSLLSVLNGVPYIILLIIFNCMSGLFYFNDRRRPAL